MTTETRVTNWSEYGHYGFARYRVWEQLTKVGIAQRHEWIKDNGDRWLGHWILRRDRSFCEVATPADEDTRPTGIYKADGTFIACDRL